MRHLVYLLPLLLLACKAEDTTPLVDFDTVEITDTTIGAKAPARADASLRTRSVSQSTVYMRLGDPVVSGDTLTYPALFKADATGIRMDGMNVRFFFSHNQLTLIGLTDYAEGYGYPGGVNESYMVASPASGPAYFNFTGSAVYVGKYMELLDQDADAVYLDDWTHLYSIQFTKKGEVEHPIVILDKERIEARGGFLRGSEGVTMVVFDPESGSNLPVNVYEVIQDNTSDPAHNGHIHWVQTSDSPPYGHPTD